MYDNIQPQTDTDPMRIFLVSMPDPIGTHVA